jgi:multidrug efflux pump subunit AcrB
MSIRAGWPVRHPVAAFLALLALSILGLALAPWLAPQRSTAIVEPALRVEVDIPGIDAAQVERAVVLPLEAGLSSLPALQQMSSRSSRGFAEIKLRFTSIGARERALGEARTRAGSASIPDESRPTVERDESALATAVTYAVTAAPLSADVAVWVDRSLRRPLQEMTDVASINVAGAEQVEIRVQPDLRRMAALGLSFDDLIRALRGREEAPRRRGARPVAGAASVTAIAARAVHLPSGESISLGEVADVSLVHKAPSEHPRFHGNEAIELRVFSRSVDGARALAERANAHIAWLRANDQVPHGVQVHTVFDESVETRLWRRQLLRRIGICILLTVAVVSLLYGAVQGLATLALFVVGLPLAAAFLWFCGLTLNDMTALGMLGASIPLVLLLRYWFSWRTFAIAVAMTAVVSAVASYGMLIWHHLVLSFVVSCGVGFGVCLLLTPWAPMRQKSAVGFARFLPGKRDTVAGVLTASSILLAIVTFVAPSSSGSSLPRVLSVRWWGPASQEVGASAHRFAAALQAAGIRNAQNSAASTDQWRLHLDAHAMELHGITLAQIGRAFTIAQEGLIIGDGLDGDTRLPLRLQLAPDVSGVAYERLLLRGEQKQQRALYFRDIGAVFRVRAPAEQLRVQQHPAAQVSARLPASVDLGALEMLRGKVEVSPGYSSDWRVDVAR